MALRGVARRGGHLGAVTGVGVVQIASDLSSFVTFQIPLDFGLTSKALEESTAAETDDVAMSLSAAVLNLRSGWPLWSIQPVVHLQVVLELPVVAPQSSPRLVLGYHLLPTGGRVLPVLELFVRLSTRKGPPVIEAFVACQVAKG